MRKVEICQPFYQSVSDFSEEEIVEEAEFADRRDLAKGFGISEEKVKQVLEDHGFSTLEDFSGREDNSSLEMSYEIREMEKRKLQGVFGERIAVFVRGRITEFLENSLGSDWELRQGVKLKTTGSDPRTMWYGDRGIDSEIKISGSTVRHRDMDEEEIVEKVRERHFVTSDELFDRFSEHQIPSIDQVYYGLKLSGEQRSRDYHLLNTESSSFSSRKSKAIDLRHVEDFKVIGLEIKTTRDRAENLFSSLQRSIRDKARESPYLDIYSLKVEYDIETGEIPDEVDLRLEKC